MPAALVTGAEGALGRGVVRELLARGVPTRVLWPPGGEPSAAEALRRAGATLAEGDLGRRFALPRLLDGCDRVVHLAHTGALDPARRDEVFRINLEHTGHLLTAAREVGITRFVLRGSPWAVGPDGGLDSWELGDCPAAPVQSMRLAELEATRQAGLGLPLLILRPTMLLGAGGGDPRLGLLRRAARGRLPLSPPGLVDVVDARDAARAFVAALQRGPIGGQWILGGHTLPWSMLLAAAAALGGHRPPLTLPLRPSTLPGHLLDPLGPRRLISLGRLVLRPPVGDTAPLWRTLGLDPRPWEESLRGWWEAEEGRGAGAGAQGRVSS